MTAITCLIVDDEQTAREGLAALLKNFPDIHLLGTCKNGVEAIDRIKAQKIDLILLDVQMPGINGFEVLANLPKPWPQVIFITAHDAYALKAFEVNALDYLLKPFSDERFEEAINRVRKHVNHSDAQRLNALVTQTQASLKGHSSLHSDSHDAERLVIKINGNIHLIRLSEIQFVEAYDYYVKIHVKDRYFLIRETMKSMEKRLPGDRFLRIHKSYIASMEASNMLHHLGNGEYELELEQGNRLKVSRSSKNKLLELLKR